MMKVWLAQGWIWFWSMLSIFWFKKKFPPLSPKHLAQIRPIVGQYCEMASTFMLQDSGKGANSAWWNRAYFQSLAIKFPASVSTAHCCDTSSRESDLALGTRGLTDTKINFSLEHSWGRSWWYPQESCCNTSRHEKPGFWSMPTIFERLIGLILRDSPKYRLLMLSLVVPGVEGKSILLKTPEAQWAGNDLIRRTSLRTSFHGTSWCCASFQRREAINIPT